MFYEQKRLSIFVFCLLFVLRCVARYCCLCSIKKQDNVCCLCFIKGQNSIVLSSVTGQKAAGTGSLLRFRGDSVVCVLLHGKRQSVVCDDVAKQER